MSDLRGWTTAIRREFAEAGREKRRHMLMGSCEWRIRIAKNTSEQWRLYDEYVSKAANLKSERK